MSGKAFTNIVRLEFEEEISEEEAAARLHMHIKTLQKKRRNKEIGCFEKGRTYTYSEAHLAAYQRSIERPPCVQATPNFGSLRSMGQTTGTSPGTTPRLSGPAALALAHQIRHKRKLSSPSMS